MIYGDLDEQLPGLLNSWIENFLFSILSRFGHSGPTVDFTGHTRNACRIHGTYRYCLFNPFRIKFKSSTLIDDPSSSFLSLNPRSSCLKFWGVTYGVLLLSFHLICIVFGGFGYGYEYFVNSLFSMICNLCCGRWKDELYYVVDSGMDMTHLVLRNPLSDCMAFEILCNKKKKKK